MIELPPFFVGLNEKYLCSVALLYWHFVTSSEICFRKKFDNLMPSLAIAQLPFVSRPFLARQKVPLCKIRGNSFHNIKPICMYVSPRNIENNNNGAGASSIHTVVAKLLWPTGSLPDLPAPKHRKAGNNRSGSGDTDMCANLQCKRAGISGHSECPITAK